MKAEYAQGLICPMENCMLFGKVNVDDCLGVAGVVRLNHLLRVKKALRWNGYDL